ncbi:MAG: PrgI family protein, partial [Eubacterium sp.]
FLLKKLGNISLAALGMMAVMMPLFFFAMYEKNGEPLEVILFHFIEARIIRPKIRVYRTDNFYAALMRQAQAEREVEEIVQKYQRPVSQKGKKKVPGAGVSEKRGQEENFGDHQKRAAR